ncbi:MAG: OmpA family protein [Pseudomonadota bacterium]
MNFPHAFPLVGAAIVWLGLVSPALSQDEALDTSLPGVTARLAFLTSSPTITRLGVIFSNEGEGEASASQAIAIGKIEIIDAAGNRKLYALKDANDQFLGGPISDWNEGGRWFVRLAPRSETLLWALYEPIAPGTNVDVQVPLVGSFDGVSVAAAEEATISAVTGSIPPITATLKSIKRSPGQLRVRLLLQNPGSDPVDSPGLSFADVYALDTVAKRKYPLLQGADGLYVAKPLSDENDGGRLFLSDVQPGGQLPLSLDFQAPPDEVTQVDIVLPLFPPLANAVIEGTGGAAAGGVAVAGRSEELTRVMKELGARETPETITVPLAADVLFDFDKAILKPEAMNALANVLTVIAAYPQAQLSIEGHTDSRGKDDYNQALSERRAQAVADWLLTNGGIDAIRVQISGHGSRNPVASNTKPDGSDDPEGRAKNRRVEIIIRKSGRRHVRSRRKDRTPP